MIDHLQIAAIVAALIGMATWCAMRAVVRGPSSFAAGRRQMFEGVGPSTFRRPDEMLDDVVSSRVGRALVGAQAGAAAAVQPGDAPDDGWVAHGWLTAGRVAP